MDHFVLHYLHSNNAKKDSFGNFWNLQHIFFHKDEDRFFSTSAESKAIDLYKSTPFKNLWFCPLLHIPDSPKVLKIAVNITSSQYSNSVFSATTFLNSAISVLIENVTHMKKDVVVIQTLIVLIIGS